MENKRLFLIISLLLVSYLLTQEWVKDYGPKPAAVETDVATGVPTDGNVVSSQPTTDNDVPAVTSDASALPVPSEPTATQAKRKTVRVLTDVFDAVIDTKNGALIGVDLVTYPVSITEKDNPIKLMQDGNKYFVAESGLSESKGAKVNAIFEVEKTEFILQDGQETLNVDLTWTSPEGLTVIKQYQFHRGSFAIDVNFTLKNNTADTWKGGLFRELKRVEITGDSSAFVYTYLGGVIYTEKEKFEKIDFDDMLETNLNEPNKGGWVAMIQHYFLAAWVPNKDQQTTFYSRVLNKQGNPKYVLGFVNTVSVPQGATEDVSTKLYVGPKLQHSLEALSEGLDLTVDYGVLTVLAQPLYWALEFFFSIFGNWGFAIIFVTILIKLIFYKLSEASYTSMANMRKLSPKLKALKERYGDDRAKMNKAMMEMYKKEKINPLGGCLPILVQIPVFIALYWVLLESVELRQAPFILWIEDLSIADPYFILPLLMGVSMFIQQKLNPAPVDPIQAKVMMMLPFVFTIFFALFPAGLVLYWVVNNTLSISQQYVITKRIEAKK